MPRAQRKTAAAPKPAQKSSVKAGSRHESKTKRKVSSSKEIRKSKKPPVKTRTSTVFFWKETEPETGFLSPWYKAPFKDDGVTYQSTGHVIMAAKARLFDDKDALQRINASTSTDEQKLLGSAIKGFDEQVWRKNAFQVAEQANTAKFFKSNNASALQEKLKALGERELVLASPDLLFGIGFMAHEAEKTSREEWGSNFFGLSLMQVREKIIPKSAPCDFDSSVFDVGGRLSVWW